VARVLVIDDSKFSRNMTMRALREAGHEVLEAPDGAAGLRAVHEHCPDCVVLDMLMPVLDGPGFLHNLRSGGSDLPVLVLTADIQAGTRSHCEDLGICGFLNKPARAQELSACIERALCGTTGVRP
jgi:CheY-like chemotaxis protein